MTFVSFAFALFFAVVIALRLVLDRARAPRAYVATLVVASLVFYAWHVPAYLAILLATTLVSFYAARAIARRPTGARLRRTLLVLALTFDLGLLAFFKYFDFAMGGVGALLSASGAYRGPVPRLELALPLGVSFYTFEAISYLVDVYRGRIAPAPELRQFLLFIAFFPHLVAGPIVRARDFLYQVGRRRRPRARVFAEGAYLMIRGFFLKVVVADNLGRHVDRLWPMAEHPGAGSALALLVTVLFAIQILCDFDGYSTIARGAAYLLGFRLPINFDTPYNAGTFRDFWRRWHITLSQWLRDYLYLPLGGNRRGRVRTYVNLMIVMVLGGLWHGANVTFLCWGVLHGLALAVERALGMDALAPERRLLRAAWFVVVQSVVLVAWVFFRAPTLAGARAVLANLFGGVSVPLPTDVPVLVLLLLALPPLAAHLRHALVVHHRAAHLGPDEKAVWGALMLYAICIAYGPTTRFIYFQF